jgi:hypothetical protein
MKGWIFSRLRFWGIEAISNAPEQSVNAATESCGCPPEFAAPSPIMKATPTNNRRTHGFALVMVIWLFGLIAAIITGFLLKVRVENLIAGNLASGARVEWIADGMTRKVALELASLATPPAPGVYHRCVWTDGTRVEVALQDQAGLVDLNTASFSVLEVLLQSVGVADAKRIVVDIGDYRDRDREGPSGSKEPAQYDGLNHGPKNAPFDSVAEVLQVPGVTFEVFSRLASILTVHSFESGLDPRVAPPALKQIITRAPDVFKGYVARTKSFSYAIDVRVEDQRRSRFQRRAITILHRQPGRPFSFLSWTRTSDWGDDFSRAQFTASCLAIPGSG